MLGGEQTPGTWRERMRPPPWRSCCDAAAMCQQINDLHQRPTEIGVAKMVSWSIVQVNVGMRLTHCGTSDYRKGLRGRRGPGLVGFSTAESTNIEVVERREPEARRFPPRFRWSQARCSSKLSNSGGERLGASRRESPLGASKVGFSLGQRGWPDDQGNSAVGDATRRIHHSGGDERARSLAQLRGVSKNETWLVLRGRTVTVCSWVPNRSCQTARV